MKQGGNYLILFAIPEYLNQLSKVIYTFEDEEGNQVSLEYPGDYVKLNKEETHFIVSLTQESTLKMFGVITIEAQYIYNETGVVKTEYSRLYMNSTLKTTLVEDDIPIFEDKTVPILPESISTPIYLEGTLDYEELMNKPRLNDVELIGNTKLTFDNLPNAPTPVTVEWINELFIE